VVLDGQRRMDAIDYTARLDAVKLKFIRCERTFVDHAIQMCSVAVMIRKRQGY